MLLKLLAIYKQKWTYIYTLYHILINSTWVVDLNVKP